MKVIPLLGIINFFGPLIFKSKRAQIIVINGIIFHSLDVSKINNLTNTPVVKFLKYYDIIANFLMISYTVWKYPQIKKLSALGCIVYIFEVVCVNYTDLPYDYTDLIHGIVHGIFGYGLSLTI